MGKSTLLFMAALLSVMVGCAAAPREKTVDDRIVWPPPPMAPKIKLLSEIRSPRDAGIVKGWWQRAKDTILGASDVQLLRPYGVFADENRVVIVDTGAQAVHIMDKARNRHLLIRGDESLQFLSPIAAAADHHGALYITDSAAGAVYRLNIERKRLEPFVNGFQRPTGIAFSSFNRLLYITDTMASQVVAFDLAGNEIVRFGSRGAGIGQFNYPTDLFVDRRGSVYVTDALNARLQVFSAEGKPLRMMGEAGDSSGHFAKPKGVAVDSEGHIYIADALFDTVQIFDDVGQLLLSFGNSGSAAGEFWMPSGMYIDHNDHIYVADAYNSRIQIFQYLGSEQHDTADKEIAKSGS